jgi:hypothetical protein
MIHRLVQVQQFPSNSRIYTKSEQALSNFRAGVLHKPEIMLPFDSSTHFTVNMR